MLRRILRFFLPGTRESQPAGISHDVPIALAANHCQHKPVSARRPCSLLLSVPRCVGLRLGAHQKPLAPSAFTHLSYLSYLIVSHSAARNSPCPGRSELFVTVVLS